MFNRIRQQLNEMGMIKQLLTDAENLARAEGLDAARSEHLVIASFKLKDGSSERVLAAVGSSTSAFVSAVESQHRAALSDVGISADDMHVEVPPPGAATGLYRSSESAKQLFQGVANAAKNEGVPLTGALVLREAARQSSHGTLHRTFAHLNLDPLAVAAAASAEIESSAPKR